MISNIVQIITSAVVGALVSYLLGWLLPERPTRRNLLSILVAIGFFTGLSVFDGEDLDINISNPSSTSPTEFVPTKTKNPDTHHLIPAEPSGNTNIVFEDVIVRANIEKNQTGIEIQKGQVVTIEFIQGKWRAGPLPTWPFYGPSGDPQVPSKETFPVQTKPVMGLVGYIEATSPFWVGPDIEFTSSNKGELLLGANDDSFEDNDGYLIVKVTISK